MREEAPIYTQINLSRINLHTCTNIIMTKELRYKYNFLRDLTGLSKSDRKKFLTNCSKENLDHISEAVYNIVTGACPCKTVSKKKKFELLKKPMKRIANPKTRLSIKKKLLLDKQTGDGIFSILLSTVLPFVIDLLNKK